MSQTDGLASLNLRDHGAQRHRRAVTQDLPALDGILAHLPPDRAGIRIAGVEELRPSLSLQGSIGSIAARALGPRTRAVRAILFDKMAQTNWSLAWHQDRAICVRRRVAVAGFGPWTVKGGMPHVAPPFDLLRRMVTLRVHLDDVPASNAPLLIAPGSHRDGYVPVTAITDVVRRRGAVACLAEAGDVWLYATTILHASEAASAPMRRRVLQVDFAAEQLPGGLEWLGV